MRIAASLVVFALVTSLVVLGGRAACHEEPSTSTKPGATSTSSTTDKSTPPVPARVTNTQRPELASATIELRREPERPDEEDPRYEIRSMFVDAYDRFLTDAKLSPEQERAVLRILADAQLNAHAVYREAIEVVADAALRPSPETERRRSELDQAWLYGQIRDETSARVAEVLTEEQLVAWDEHMLWTTLLLAWGDPIRIR